MTARAARVLSVFIISTIVLTPGAAAQTRGVTAEDYFAFETLGDPHFSPDGATIAFVVTTVDQKQNRRRSQIWSVPADGSREAATLTTSPQSSNTPRWNPDGRTIAFLSARDSLEPLRGANAPSNSAGGGAPAQVNNDGATATPRTQIWLLPLGGGEPRRLTNLANGVTSFQWAPDGAPTGSW